MNKRIASAFIIIIFFFNAGFSQVPSIIEHLRVPLWAQIDSIPGLEEYDEDAGMYDYAVKGIKEVSPYIIEGMVYGWDFVYTPLDRQRGVEEYFEILPKEDFSVSARNINYAYPWIEDNKLNCWCEYTRTADEIQNFYLWSSIQNPRIHGIGYGSVDKGFEGLQDAVADGVKNAVRDYYRNIIKNKPKEITGSVLIREIPTIGIDAGRYLLNLDFFLECGRIVEYTRY